MLYCPSNVTFTVVWYNGGFSPCFIDTVTGILLAVYMLIFGTGEFYFYWRYGTPIDPALLRPRPKLYAVQLACNALLIVSPVVWLSLRAWQHSQFYGFNIFYNLIGVYVWSVSVALIILERSCDLPSPPGRGHSILLNIFWGAALALDTLNFVNFNGDAWYFVLHDEKDRALLAVFIIKWLLTMAVFVLGMMAPGMISAEARSQFIYRPLGEAANVKYGSTSSVETTLATGSNDLHSSMDQLREQLYNGDLVLSFRELPRQHAGVTVESAQLDINQSRNRYCNVLPYDFNRVLLQKRGASTSDYINASLIVVRLPADAHGRMQQAEMRYIATQGPLPNAAGDFWQMVWEQRSQTIVMLTDLSEGGMIKCHKYWPDVNDEPIQFNHRFLVSCLRSEDDKSNPMVSVREFSLIDMITQSELEVVQLQYRGWPDFGAPKKPQAFLDFIQLINRSAPDSSSRKSGPIITHCSAGIGRTGVYIMVETLVQLIDRDLPVHPLSVIKQLRSQRMGMIQTVEQLVFACEAALKYYERRKKT